VTGVGPYFVTVANGQTVSSAFALARSERGFVVMCPSNGVATSVLLGFTVTSGVGPFAVMQRYDGSGLPFAVASGVGAEVCGYVQAPPSPYARIVLGAAPSAVMTFQILERR
jgi:hypothetical protein